MNVTDEKGISLKGKDIMPTLDSQRTMSNMGFFILWIGIAVQLVTFIAAAQLYPAMSPVQILLACFLGNLIVGIIATIIGDIGVKYGIPYAVYIRACFGYLGTHIPAAIRAMPAIFWFGFQTWLGAEAINVIVKMLTGFSSLTLFIILFGIVQIINAAWGFDAIQKFEWIASPAIIIIGIIIQLVMMNHYHLSFGHLFSIKGEGGLSLTYGIVVMMGTYITVALNACDFTRFLKVKNRKGSWLTANIGSFFSQSSGLLLSMLMFTIIGFTSGVATGNWDPIQAIVDSMGENNPLLLIICLVFIIFAQWSSNISANLLPPGYIIVNFFPRKISYRTATIIAGVIGLLTLPWLLANYIPQILVVITAVLAPIVGIVICDYYLLRKRKVNVKELFEVNGQYKYWRNLNPAAVFAYIPACLSVILFPDYGFFSAFLISIVIYYPLMKFWIGKVYYQPEIYDDFDESAFNEKETEEELV